MDYAGIVLRIIGALGNTRIIGRFLRIVKSQELIDYVRTTSPPNSPPAGTSAP